MELIIQIDEAEYNKICNYDGMNVTRMMSIIQHGIPLPKGHDRLIEADEVLFQSIRDYCGPGKAYEILKSAKTIIEADKEKDNGYIHN